VFWRRRKTGRDDTQRREETDCFAFGFGEVFADSEFDRIVNVIIFWRRRRWWRYR